jgi:hypothetical protein
MDVTVEKLIENFIFIELCEMFDQFFIAQTSVSARTIKAQYEFPVHGSEMHLFLRKWDRFC